MSLGYAGFCRKELEDEETIIYSYRGENWNLPEELREKLEPIEGMFTIQKSALEEPEIHEKVVRKPNGRKKLVRKKVMHFPDVPGHIEEGTVTIDKLCGVDTAYLKPNPFPRCVRELLYIILERYMRDGVIPDEEAFIQ